MNNCTNLTFFLVKYNRYNLIAICDCFYTSVVVEMETTRDPQIMRTDQTHTHTHTQALSLTHTHTRARFHTYTNPSTRLSHTPERYENLTDFFALYTYYAIFSILCLILGVCNVVVL